MRMFPVLTEAPATTVLRFPDRALDARELADHASQLARGLTGTRRVAVWAERRIKTCVGVVAGLLAGVPVVPVDPKSGERELEHTVGDSDPEIVLAGHEARLTRQLAGRRLLTVDLDTNTGAAAALPTEPDPETSALIVYTSGTTGPPKGAMLPRRAITSNLDAIADAWAWTAGDVVASALPLFHVHGLVLGILGPLRRGGYARYVGRFSLDAIATTLRQDATMLFGVPTMYRRLADAAEQDAQVAAALGRARLLVSGSNALPPAEHARIEALTGQRIVERYGMTETLMNASTRADGDRRAGTVRPPLHGVQVRLVDDGGRTLDTTDGQTMGEIHVRGPNVFLEYLNLPDATAGAFHEGWFATDDVATRSADGYLHIVGRRATDLIESGGYKIGAGEIEDVLREHPAVEDAAVTGEPDDDLGERIVAWVVRRPGKQVSGDELVSYVARMLDPHKRPRVVRFVDELPHDALGKVQKNRLPR
jgi:malonyl-CoA/methylmalonyl-CoA synthetase